jgi:hypothetical protein
MNADCSKVCKIICNDFEFLISNVPYEMYYANRLLIKPAHGICLDLGSGI